MRNIDMGRIFIRVALFVKIFYFSSTNIVHADEFKKNQSILEDQFGQLAAVPEFNLSREKIEKIMDANMHEVRKLGTPEDGPERDKEVFDFGPTPERPYGFSWITGPGLTQYHFQWQNFGKPYMPFEGPPAGLCISPVDLEYSFTRSGWKLLSTDHLPALPPINTYVRGKYGRLQVVFEESSNCLIEVILTSSVAQPSK